MGNEADFGFTPHGDELPAAAGTATAGPATAAPQVPQAAAAAATPAGDAAAEAAASAMEVEGIFRPQFGFDNDGGQFWSAFGANMDPAAIAFDNNEGTSDDGSSASGSPVKAHPNFDHLL